MRFICWTNVLTILSKIDVQGSMKRYGELSKTLHDVLQSMKEVLEETTEILKDDDDTIKQMNGILRNLLKKYTTIGEDPKEVPSFFTQEDHIWSDPSFLAEVDEIVQRVINKHNQTTSGDNIHEREAYAHENDYGDQHESAFPGVSTPTEQQQPEPEQYTPTNEMDTVEEQSSDLIVFHPDKQTDACDDEAVGSKKFYVR